MTKQSLLICHNAVGSIQAKNSEQAIALAQCLGELEEEMKKQERGENVVVMQPKQDDSATRRRSKKNAKPVEVPAPEAPAEA